MTVTLLLTEGEYSDHRAMGVFQAVAELDWRALHDQYLAHQDVLDAEAEADWRTADADKFVAWLVAGGHLTPVRVQSHQVEIETHRLDDYVPPHWPVCPTCGEGRGEPKFKNRFEDGDFVHRTWSECTVCGHHWGEKEE